VFYDRVEKFMTETIGFIGQGFVGSAYAENYTSRGYRVVVYEKGDSYRESKKKMSVCDIVFIAVPTPTTPSGFNDGIVREVIKIVSPGTTVVIKSTVLPGTTESIQAENPDIYVLFSPEFLSVATAKEDAAHPPRNIIGIPADTPEYQTRAAQVLKTLPQAAYTKICSAREAEIIKYGKNTLGFIRILHTNILYDLAAAHGVPWDAIKEAMSQDPDIPGDRYLSPVHKTGRGAGGECFIKDFEAFLREYEAQVVDPLGVDFLKSAREKNLMLLRNSHKDEKIIRGVYGNP
jgi:UDPglucose 6-dehydrogenase